MNSPTMATFQPIAIIGAGLSGLTLALALHQQQIPCVIYETRPAPLDIGGALMLSPNALRILDRLGVYERLAPVAYHFEDSYFRTEDGQPLDTFEFGSKEKYGYSGVRVYRFELINVLLGLLSERGIVPVYGKKFSRMVREDAGDDGVTWAFEDGSTATAPLLIGADGIHSRVRTYIAEDAKPVFTKMMGVSAAVPRSQLGDAEYPMPVTIMNRRGAFVAAPQGRRGDEVFIGKQRAVTEDLDREGWDRLLSDKEWCVEYLRRDLDTYPPMVANAVSHIPIDKINIWPFYVIPKLASWTSEAGRVIILGDAAHAIPPTAGQGVNQAFEDVYTLARVVGRPEGDRTLSVRQVMKQWQAKRQERIDGVLQLNAAINKRRMPTPGEEISTEPFDLRWLYGVDFDKMVEEMLAAA